MQSSDVAVAEVINKATGAVAPVPSNAIDLDAASVVRLRIDRSQVASMTREGDDLVLRLTDGRELRIVDCFQEFDGVTSDVVLADTNGSQWLAKLTREGPRYSLIDDASDLVAAAGGAGGGALTPLLGVLGAVAAGGIAVAAGGGGGDDDGSPSNPGGPLSPNILDTQPPAAPVGRFNGAGTLITGTGEAGATVQVRDAAGQLVASGTVGADGTFSVPLGTAQDNGERLTLTQTDPAGNVSPPTPLTAPDISAPAAPGASINAGGDVVRGMGEPGAQIEVRDENGTLLGRTVVGPDGSFTLPLDAPRTDGETLTVTQIDGAGNPSPAATLQAPDSTAPMAPQGGVAADGAAVVGSGEPGAVVTITGPGGTIGSVVIPADGRFTLPLVPPLVSGETIEIVQADPAGNPSPPTLAQAPDLTAPASPTGTISGDGATVTGTGEPGAVVRVTTLAGQSLGTDTVDAQGAYSVGLTPAQVNGELLLVRQRDGAGNPSPAVPLTAPDLTDPGAPTATIDATGTTITGTGEPGATIRVTNAAGETVGTGTVGNDGGFAVPLTPVQADGQVLTVVQVDPASNLSEPVIVAAPDITGPPAPTLEINAEGTGASGTGEPGATVILTAPGGTVIGTAVVAANGTYVTALTPPQVNGEQVTATQSDGDGNASAPVIDTAPDFTAPAMPTATISAGGASVTGSGEPGATITITDAGGTVIGTAQVDATGSFIAPLTPIQANGETIALVQTDAAGNDSDPLSLTALDTTRPDAPFATIDATGSIVTGTGEPNAAITVRDGNGVVLGTGVANAAGAFAIVLPIAQVLAEPLTVTQADAANNESLPTPLSAPDLTAPEAPVAAVGPDGTTITGTGEPNATIIVIDPVGAEIGRGVASPDGTYTMPIAPAQIDGEVVQVWQMDPAGNLSPPTVAVAPDLVPDAGPGAPTATVAADGLSVSGVGEPDALVTVWGPGGVPLGSAVVAADGSYTVILTTPQRNGETVRVAQEDAAGERSPSTIALAPDLTAPEAPTATLDGAGASVVGTGEPGATITITDPAGAVIGTATVNVRGSYIAVLSPAQTNGETLGVVQTDPAGNASPTITLLAPDVTAPTAPVAAIAPDGASVTGTGEPGATITVRGAGGIVLGSALVAIDGSFTAALTPAQVNSQALQVVQADAAGNASPVVPLVAPDLTDPFAPTLVVSGDGASAAGSGEPGATVTISDPAGTVLGTAIVSANGTYATVLAPPQIAGQLLSAVQVDRAGNDSVPVNASAPDLTAPGAPVAAVSGDGTSVTGTGEVGATVTVTSALGAVIGTGTVGPDGSYAVALTPAQANGQALSVTLTDAASNTSAVTVAIAPDITSPDAPTLAIAPDGASASGTGEPGAVVSILDVNGALIGEAIVAANGTYSAVLLPVQANGELLAAVQSDEAGNDSAAATAFAPDLTAPTAPIAVVSADGASISGTGEAGATVTVTDPAGVVIGRALVGADGRFATGLTPPQANGQTLTLIQEDAAGNDSPSTQVIAPDMTAPAGPTLAIVDGGATASGTGEPGATITLTSPAGAVIGTATVRANGSYSATLSPAQTNGERVTAVQSDASGNASGRVTALAPDFTAPDVAVAQVLPDGTQVVGTGEPGARVTVTNAAGAILGSGFVAGDGSFAVTLTPAQANGGRVGVTLTDAAGNASPAVQLAAPDITAPAAPTITVAGDGLSASGTGEAGATVTITDPTGQVIGTAVVAINGTYTAAFATPQVNGQLLTASQRDGAGNPSPTTTGQAPDLVAPAEPTAAVSADGTQVTGTGEPGAAIVITDSNNVVIGAGAVDSSGNYAVRLTTPQTNGEVLTAVQSDAVGNVSDPAVATAPDLTPPAAPTGTVSPDGTQVTGTGEIGATVTITAPGAGTIGTATVGADGTYTVVLAAPQRNGEVLEITQADRIGNLSPPATATAPDSTPPAAPTGTISPDGVSISGSGEPGAAVTIRAANGVVIGTATVAANGSYTTALTPAQANGGSVSVSQVDAAGNLGPAASVAAPDVTVPLAPAAAVSGDGTTVTGTGEPGTRVNVTTPTGTPLGTAIVGSDGSFTVPIAPAQANGELVRVTLTDGGGNVSPATAVLAPDITAPEAPTATVSPNGALITGTGEPGATVTITGPNGLTATAVVTGNGTFTATLTPPQADGETLTVTQRDVAGNLSDPLVLTAPDGTAPLVPTATINGDGTIVSGTGVEGATITIFGPGGTAIGSAVVAAGGTYAATLTTPQRNGELLSVAQADGAGNVSPRLPLLAPDITPPAAPTLVVSSDGSTVSGTGEAGARVTLTSGGTIIGTTIVAADGSYAALLSPPQANGGTITATQADSAGNASPPVSVAAPDITAPLAPTGVAVTGDGTAVTGSGEPAATVTIRNGAGVVIGSGTVGADGTFTVGLTAPQVTGATLGVTLSDAAGNRSPAVAVTAPFDIDAFDNSNTASVDLLPVAAAVNHGTANYTALVSLGLLNLQAEVLGTPTVNFTVRPGHTFDGTFTYDALLSIGALSGYSVVVQRFDGTRWVAASGTGTASVVELGLLNGDLVANQSFGPGQYRAFLTFQGTLGVGLLGSLNVSGTDLDYTDVGSAVAGTTSGNVITDAGAGGVDIVNAQTVVQSVTINGVTTSIVADGTIVDGQFGTLVMNRNGSYTYTPDADATAIGRTEQITYTLRDGTDGELESATLSIGIGSPDVTAAPIAVADSDIATVAFRNVEADVPSALEFRFNTPGTLLLPVTRAGSDSFTVAANTVSDVSITAIRSGLLTVLPSYTITVTNAATGAVVRTVTQTAVAGLPLGSGVVLTIEDLPAGNYNYTVSSTNVVGTPYTTSVYISETITYLDRFEVSGTAPAEGNLFANDTVGTDFAAVRIGTGATFTEVGDVPLSIAGRYGTLTVDEVGNYVYRPSETLTYSATDLVDSFTYQLVQPNGTIATATLNVTVDVPADGISTAQSKSAADDIVPLTAFAAQIDDGSAAAPIGDPHPQSYAFGMAEGEGELEAVLQAYLSAQSGDAPAAAVEAEGDTMIFDIGDPPAPADPLEYLVLQDELYRHQSQDMTQY